MFVILLTGVNVTNNPDVWTKAIPKPPVIQVNGQDVPIEAVIELVTCSPVRTLVTDPLGRQAGLDPNTGDVINEISGAIVTKDGDEPHLIIVPQIDGQYQVQTTGIGAGDYTIGAFEISDDTLEVTARIFQGTTTVGETRQFGFDLSSFQEQNGQVVMEAEHFAWYTGQTNQVWVDQTSQPGYVGSGYLSALPDIDQLYESDYDITSSGLEYSINFINTGDYYVWIRGYAPNGAGDSVYVGLDDQPATILTGLPPRQWAWANKSSSGSMTVISVTQPGEHKLRIWQREDGIRLDRILLTNDDGYIPAGNGPDESLRMGSTP